MKTEITVRVVIKSANRHRQFSPIMAAAGVRAAMGGITGSHMGHEGQAVYFYVDQVEVLPGRSGQQSKIENPKSKIP